MLKLNEMFELRSALHAKASKGRDAPCPLCRQRRAPLLLQMSAHRQMFGFHQSAFGRVVRERTAKAHAVRASRSLAQRNQGLSGAYMEGELPSVEFSSLHRLEVG